MRLWAISHVSVDLQLLILMTTNLFIIHLLSILVRVAQVTFDIHIDTIDDPYTRICAPNKVENMDVKVFSLASKVNKTRFLVQHESYGCKFRLNENSVTCNRWCHLKMHVIQSRNGIRINVSVKMMGFL